MDFRQGLLVFSPGGLALSGAVGTSDHLDTHVPTYG